MARLLPRRVAILLCALLAGCVGTSRSRAAAGDVSRWGFFGWPLYGAVVEDVDVILTGGDPKLAGFDRVLAYPSLPIDLLLDTVLLGFSSGMGIGHSKDQLPTVLSGGGALGVKHHGHLRLADKTPLSSLWHTMLDRMGVELSGPFQDSSGPIKDLLS